MKYKTLYELRNAYDEDSLDLKMNPMMFSTNNAFVEDNSDQIVFEMSKDELISEMAYLLDIPISY